jgi:hypothetical protein
VGGFYAHSEDVKTLHRRSYHLLDIDSGSTAHPPGQAGNIPSLVLVHYFDTASTSKRTAEPDSCLGKKREMAVSIERSASRIKREVFIGNMGSVVNTLFEENLVFNGWQNQVLPNAQSKLSNNSGLGDRVLLFGSADWLLKQKKETCSKECLSNDLSSQQRKQVTQDQNVNDEDLIETVQKLTCKDDAEKSRKEGNCSIGNFAPDNEHVRDERSSIVLSDRTFEADFDVLWTHLCNEFGGAN